MKASPPLQAPKNKKTKKKEKNFLMHCLHESHHIWGQHTYKLITLISKLNSSP